LALRAPERQPAPAAAGARTTPYAHGEKRIMAIAAGAALLGAVLVLLGQALWFKPAPALAPAPVVQAAALSDEQAAAVRNAEKLAKIVQKLDARTRDKIQAEMQKP
jgi:4-hydroxybenzoate polyprenyltransferase